MHDRLILLITATIGLGALIAGYIVRERNRPRYTYITPEDTAEPPPADLWRDFDDAEVASAARYADVEWWLNDRGES